MACAASPATAAFLDEVGNERVEEPFTAKTVREVVQRFLR